MRFIIKKIAALGSLIGSMDYCRNTVASCWSPLLLIVVGLFVSSMTAMAATKPDTTLTNKVSVNYTVGSGAAIRTESSVSLTTSDRTPAKIAFFSQFAGGDSLNVQPTLFSPDGSDSNWQPVVSSVEGNTALIQTISFSTGEPLIVRVEDFDQNLDATVLETIIIDLKISNNGDIERLILTETDPSSGVFVGVVPLVSDVNLSPNNGQLSVQTLSEINAKYIDREDATDTVATVGIVDPSNLVFDSTTGEPINGATITLVSIGSSQGARVYDQFNGDWPSTVVSGEPVSSSGSSRTIPMGDGEFQFPRVLNGQYELRVTPPVGYRYPSQQSQTQLLQLGDIADQVATGSRGEAFSIADALGAVLLNIPLDPFNGRFSVQKKVDQSVVSIGDEVIYTVIAKNNDPLYSLSKVILKDSLPPGFRYQQGSAKNSAGTLLPSESVTVDGRALSFTLGTLTASTSQQISYRVMIGAGSPIDEAINTVQGFSEGVESNVARASVEMRDELMRTKNILIGRVYSGDCKDTNKQQPIKNARLYLDNGRTVLTDKHGRWHLEGLSPGTHAIQLDETSLPSGMMASPCKLTASHVKQPHSRMVTLQQGHLWQVNFHVALAKDGQKVASKAAMIQKPEYKLPSNPLVLYGAKYAENTTAGFGIIWPPEKYIPAISSIKIAVKYPPKNRLKLLLNDKPINPVNLEGSDSNRAKTVGIKRWAGVDITQKSNTIVAILQDKSGKEIKRIKRYVHFTERSVKASVIAESSVLIADGFNQSVIAIRLEDEDGFSPRPRTRGYFSLDQGHWRVVENAGSKKSASVALNKSQDGKYEYIVSDDGLVRIKLEPTTKSGHITINMALSGGKTGAVKAWLKPALRDWIMVGFANGTVGHKRLSGNMQTLADLGQEEGLYKEAQVSFFAKGRIKGDYLLTLAYDSDKQIGEVGEQLNGVIDPDAWYTLYGDEQQHQHETPSSSKLYVKLEKQQFYALFGDYATEMDVTELGSYERVLHGLKSSYEGKNLQYTAFASETSRRYQRDEIQGDGTSGLYYLSRLPVNQSEQITLETRDRDDLGSIKNSRTLSRYSDYDIDYKAKTIFFKFPISGSDDQFNPIFIVVEYESEDDAGEKVFAVGGRVGIKRIDDRLQAGVTYLREDNDQLLAVDAKFEVNDKLRLKAEIARSKATIDANAWTAEAEYRDEKWQARLFAKQQASGFGLGQQSGLAEGERSVGLTARYNVTNQQAVIASISQLDKLDNDNQRVKRSIEWQKSGKDSQLSVGYHQLEEQVDNIEKSNDSIRIGGSKSFNAGKVALSIQVEKALKSTGSTEQNPDRFKVGIDYKLSEKVSLFAEQEYVRNDLKKHSNSRIGLKSKLWEGGNVHTDLLRQNNDENDGSARNYAVLGLSQHWQVDEHLHFDLNVDKAKTIELLDYTPLSTSATNTINTDDYLSVSLGAGWNNKAWSAAARAEYRDSESSTRRSLQYNAVRKLGDHYAVSKQARVLDTRQANGDSKRQAKLGFSIAVRAKDYDYTALNQLDYLNDTLVTSGVKSRTSKFINNLHYNRDVSDKLEMSIHHGAKFTQLDTNMDHWGLTDTMQIGARYDINKSWDVGAQAGYLHHWDTSTVSGFAGLSLGFTPAKNTRIELGYNFDGFSDDDFSGQNYTHQGPYISLNYLLDQSLLKVFDRPKKNDE